MHSLVLRVANDRLAALDEVDERTSDHFGGPGVEADDRRIVKIAGLPIVERANRGDSNRFPGCRFFSRYS